MRRLVFKHTTGKPPFIGIRFEDVSKAETLNVDLIQSYKTLEYFITIEPLGNKVQLRLCSDEPVIMRKYDNLEYDVSSLKDFIKSKANHKMFNFGHIIRSYQYDVPAKTRGNSEIFVLKVVDVKIIYNEY